MPKSSLRPTSANGPKNLKVVALVYDGLRTFEFGSAVELFGLPRPEMGPNWYTFATAAIEQGPLRGLGGVQVIADGGLDLVEQAGTIIVAGWRGADKPVPQPVIEALQKAHASGARVMSICSGVFVLAAAGLLKGRRATTHWHDVDTLRVRYPDIDVVPDVLYVDEGDILTSAGSAAGLDLGLHLIRRDFGPRAANIVARRLVVPPHRDGGQAQLIQEPVPDALESSRLSPILDRMRANLGREHTVKALAEAAGMSSRTFLRRFEAATGTTPARWLLAERLARARDLLETTPAGVEQIAHAVGFRAAALRRHFRARFATTPRVYRARFTSAT
ncbi:transcriptional regulator FtrA [Caulobacter sp. RL271]|uniref:Transcriptional regulator FtrA n=1 Tax=Caulobacter segnis TaxID=88688 RepID=A0ABY4ZST2_9CAUL|nr:transcriptional regulator FtrA [Caulobacter segnis]USQ95750.1 transcriptional regulator FtrA [Caulobacter segnis]